MSALTAPVVARANALLVPVEKGLLRFRKLVSWGLLALNLAALAFLLDPQGVKPTGGLAMDFLILVSFLGPAARVTGLRVLGSASLFRKELGALMGTFSLVHGAQFLMGRDAVSPLSADFWWYGGMPTYLAWGAVAAVLAVPLWATSNAWSQRMMGRRWKTLHRAAYLILPTALLHVAFIKGEFAGPAVVLAAYAALKFADWKGWHLAK